MKKNKRMRTASGLMIAALLTTSMISGTFAKYTTADAAQDSARAAKWGVNLGISGSLYGDAYAGADSNTIVSNTDSSVTVKSSAAGTDVIAPGTRNSNSGLHITLNGTPEVSTRVYGTIKTQNIYLKKGEYGVMVEAHDVKAEDFANKSANFSNVTFKVTDGYMEITPVTEEVVVTIVGNNDSAVYDGTEHKVTGYTVVSISNKLYKESDFSFSGTAEAKRTEAGTTYMGLTEEHFKNKNENFSKVIFNVTDGYMEITPVTEEVVVTIEGNHDSKVYDGEEHVVTGYKVTDISNELYAEGDFDFIGTAEVSAPGTVSDSSSVSSDSSEETDSTDIPTPEETKKISFLSTLLYILLGLNGVAFLILIIVVINNARKRRKRRNRRRNNRNKRH